MAPAHEVGWLDQVKVTIHDPVIAVPDEGSDIGLSIRSVLSGMIAYQHRVALQCYLEFA